MNLKLVDADKAKIFQVPARDTEYDTAVATLLDQHSGWSAADCKRHVDAAITAGVYAPEATETAEEIDGHD